jgi:hypothetical protein
MGNQNKKKYPNRELAVYALFLLGGDTNRIHTEDIALKCFELSPSSFSWVKYQQYPDKDIVRMALMDARKELFGAFVDGRAGQKRGLSAKTGRHPIDDGWVLTTNGINWIRENLSGLQLLMSSGEIKEHRQKVLKQLKRTREHSLFLQYTRQPSNFSPMIGEIADLLRCRVDAEDEIWMQRFDQMRRQVEATGHKNMLDFVEKCHEAYLRQK